MRTKSIDGLSRRSEVELTRVFDENKKRTYKRSVGVGLEPKKLSLMDRGPGVAEQDNEAIADFLSSVQDEDPTNLVAAVPDREEDDGKKKKRPKGEKKEKKLKGRRRPLKIALLVLGGLLLIVLGVGIFLIIQGNDLVARVTGGSIIDAILGDSSTPLATDPSSGRTNILVFGTSGYSMEKPAPDNGWLTDSMMMVSIDQDTGDMRAISLPRDLKVPTCNASSKLNEIYQCEYLKKGNQGTPEGERAGANALAAVFENVLGVKIQYKVHVNWQAVVQVVNALGGIDVAFVYQGTEWSGEEVAIETTDRRGLADYWNARTRTYGIQFENGKVAHLNGDKALAVARSRGNSKPSYGQAGGNFSREQFQQKIILATIAKARKANLVGDLVAAMKIKDAVGDNIRMTFAADELKTLMKLAGTLDLSGMKSIPVERKDDGTYLMGGNCGTATNGQALSYVCPNAGVGNYSAIRAYVARKLSSDPMVAEGARVVVLNAGAAAGMAGAEGVRLTAKGFDVTKTGDAPKALGAAEGVRVYQKAADMTGTAAALKAYYGDVINTTIPAALTNTVGDFIIVIGAGFTPSAAE